MKVEGITGVSVYALIHDFSMTISVYGRTKANIKGVANKNKSVVALFENPKLKTRRGTTTREGRLIARVEVLAADFCRHRKGNVGGDFLAAAAADLFSDELS